MISARNRLQRLNGSEFRRRHVLLSGVAFLCLLLICSGGCTGTRKTQKTQTSSPPERNDMPLVYNPATGKYEPVEDPAQLVDTVYFEEDKTKEPVSTVEEKKYRKKSEYHVAFLMPFNTSYQIEFTDGIDPKLRRFLHYYAGVRMAIRDLNEQGIRITAEVHDVGESGEKTKRVLQQLDKPDVIVGTYEMENVLEAAAYAGKNKVPVFSPWTPSIPVDESNPFFVQLTPGLEAHVMAIVDFIDEHFPQAKVYTVARNDAREKSRLSMFHAHHNARTGTMPYEDLIIEDQTAMLSNTPLASLLSEDRPTLFILPLYSRNDEDFVNGFLRKLHAEKGNAEVYVFGLPQWLTFNNLRPDYLESTNVHVSTAQYIDYSDTGTHLFQKRFLETFGTIPEHPAHQGYTFTLFLGRSLWQYGTGFLEEVTSGPSTSQDFQLRPVYESDGSELHRRISYYENRDIDILRFQNHAYRKVD